MTCEFIQEMMDWTSSTHGELCFRLVSRAGLTDLNITGINTKVSIGSGSILASDKLLQHSQLLPSWRTYNLTLVFTNIYMYIALIPKFTESWDWYLGFIKRWVSSSGSGAENLPTLKTIMHRVESHIIPEPPTMTEGRLWAASRRVVFDVGLFTFAQPTVPRSAIKSGLCSFSPP